MKKMNHILLVSTLVALIFSFLCCQVAGQETENELESQVESLLTFPSAHGLIFLNRDQQKTFDKIIADPKSFLPIIERLSTRDLEAGDRHRFSRAIYILERMEHHLAYDLLAKLFVRASEMAKVEKNPQKQKELDALQYPLLSSLGSHKSKKVVEIVLAKLPQTAAHNRGSIFAYLMKSCVGSDEVTRQLEAWRADKTSPLHDDPNLERALQIISQENEKKANPE
jgi:hypothetical protein